MTTSTKLIVVGAASLLSMAMAAGGVLPGDGALSTATASGQVQQASGVASVPAHPVLARVRSIAAVQDRDRLAVQDRDRLAVPDQDRVAGPRPRCGAGPGSPCGAGPRLRCGAGPGSRCGAGPGSPCGAGPGSPCGAGPGSPCGAGPDAQHDAVRAAGGNPSSQAGRVG